MTVYNLLGPSPYLQSSDAWAQQQALEQIQRNVVHAMHSLSAQEKNDYIRLQREAQKALVAMDTEKNALITAFKTEGLAQLRARLDGRDPEQYRIKTTYMEKRELPFPWDANTRQMENRPRRAYEEARFKLHTKDMTLWEAACLNFGFTHSIRQDSGYSLVEASTISGPGESLDTSAFVRIARELDLGAQLQQRIGLGLALNGKLRKLFSIATKAALQFELLDAWRARSTTCLTRQMYDALLSAVSATDAPLKFDTYRLTAPPPSLVVSGVPLPLLLIHVASLGVVSYFPFRPGGAFRYHIDTQAAEVDLRQQLKDSHQKNDLGWLSRQLPLRGLPTFIALLNNDIRPEGLSWLAEHLYDGFHQAFPARTLDNARFSKDLKTGVPVSLTDALTSLHIQRYQSDLDTLATPRSDADWQALKDGAAALAGEILQVLMTPMPGGVTGMNRIMQLAVLGSMTYSIGQGLVAAIAGEPSSFASAMSDVADLVVSGHLIKTASRAHSRRMQGYLKTLGNPRKITRTDGVDELWRPDARPFAIPHPELLDGRSPDALGLYTVGDKTYAKLREGNQTVMTEVSHDPKNMRYVLKHANGDSYTPAIVFEPIVQAWVFDLKNAHTLSDIQLLQRMLPNGDSTLPDTNVEQMLRGTATTRTDLDAVWSAQPAPLGLIEGVRRLQADRAIHLIIERFNEPGYLPPHADALVFGLLTQLPNWPADCVLNVKDEQGVLIERYSPSAELSATPHTVSLTRREDGRYADVDNQALPPGTVDALMRLIIRQQPGSSTLGKEDGATHTEDLRMSTLRRQVAELAARERHALFSAAVNYAGHENADLSAPADTRRYLPLKATPSLVVVTPLLKKLRDLNRPLSAPNFERLLEQEPLTPRQQQDYLQNGTLPLEFRDALDRQRTALRIDAIIDALYHPREFAEDTDQWAREFASSFVSQALKRPFVINDIAAGETYTSTGPDDLTVELRHYGKGHYRAYDMRNGGEIPVSPVADSFNLAIASVLQPHEHALLGMSGASDAKGLRKTLGDAMVARRNPQGLVSLADQSLMQYEQRSQLPTDKAPEHNGLYSLNAKQYLPLFGSLYEVVFDKSRQKWSLVHPKKTGVNTPTLEHNHEGAWRLSSENPMTWDDHSLLYRLGNHTYAFTQEMAGKIMALTDTSPEALRQVHCSGQPAPPLLADTCKRFKIDEQIQLFIKAMRAAPTAAPARPPLQLLILNGIRGWPADHVLQIVDSQQRVLQQYPTDTTADAKVITVTQQEYNSGKLLGTVIKNDAVCQGLLGETPTAHDDRLFKLVKKIVAFTELERTQVFNSIYAHSELDGSVQEKNFKLKHPNLSTSTVKAILGHATPRELNQLHEKNQVGLRLSERARLSAHDLRLNRAYEGLYLPSCANADSDKITLHLLRFLPDWPKKLRVDIHQDDHKGSLLESAGHLDGSVRRRLGRTQEGYQAYDTSDKPMGARTPSLLKALAQCLSVAEQTTLGITENEGVSAWREQVVALALVRRVEIKGLLDLPHLQLWMQPPMQVDRSFLAYPIWSGRWSFGANRPPDLISRVQKLYPSMSTREANVFIRLLNRSESDALIELNRLKAEFQSMDTALTRWSETHQAIDDRGPAGIHQRRRRTIANEFRSAWRRERPRGHYYELGHMHGLHLDLGASGLPPTTVFSGVTGLAHIEHLSLKAHTYPVNTDRLLRQLPGLVSMNIRTNLADLPKAVTDMTQLRYLRLPFNNLILTVESSARLANMVGLRHLDLSYNLLGRAPDVSRLSQLNVLNLCETQIRQWPTGALPSDSLTLDLEHNLIQTIPEEVFTNPQGSMTPANTLLHGNPLTRATRQRIADHERILGIRRRNLHNVPHVAQSADAIDLWLVDIPKAQHKASRELWSQLQTNEEVSADDVFQVLRDLPKTFAYTASKASREALSTRVWNVLLAMADSTELRYKVCLNTYGAGSCGDSVLLAFTNMELEHLIHEAKMKPRGYDSDRALIALSTGRFYLNQLDQISDAFIRTREAAGRNVDPAETTIYFRAQLAREFNLPLRRLELLYTVERYVTQEILDGARAKLRQLGQSAALQEWLLMEGFWIEYLARSHPEPFNTIKDTIQYKVEALNKELPDKHSDVYLERRQSLVDEEKDEHNRLVRQLTAATQATLKRV